MIDLKGVAERAGYIAHNLGATDDRVRTSLNQSGETPWSGYALGVTHGIERLLKQLELEGYKVVEQVHTQKQVAKLMGSEYLSTEVQEQLHSVVESIGAVQLNAEVLNYAGRHGIDVDTALYTLLQDPNWLTGLVPTVQSLELHASREVGFDVEQHVITPTHLYLGDHLITTELTLHVVPDSPANRIVYVVMAAGKLLGFLTVYSNDKTVVFNTSTDSEHYQFGNNLTLTLSLT